MKRILLFLLLYLFLFYANAQNVGIGTVTPSEKLDVAGNVNIAGTIKANGTAGKSGQVLGTNSQGLLQWTDGSSGSSGYKNFASFSSDGTWIVPDTVTQISIEMWGGGGGGAFGGGGASGEYRMISRLPVTSAKTITIDIGPGGAGATTVNGYGTAGTYTVVQYLAQSYTAGGGQGAGHAVAGVGNTPTSNITNGIIVPGNNGEPNTITTGEYGKESFVRTIHHGDGGRSYGFSDQRSGMGGTTMEYLSGGSNAYSIYSVAGTFPGSGGGGGPDGYGKYGSAGAHGLVIIHY